MMAMDQVQVVMAKRKPNWSESELLALSDAVASNISIIRGQFGPGLTLRMIFRSESGVAKVF
jgi:hypothetical protein